MDVGRRVFSKQFKIGLLHLLHEMGHLVWTVISHHGLTTPICTFYILRTICLGEVPKCHESTRFMGMMGKKREKREFWPHGWELVDPPHQDDDKKGGKDWYHFLVGFFLFCLNLGVCGVQDWGKNA